MRQSDEGREFARKELNKRSGWAHYCNKAGKRDERQPVEGGHMVSLDFIDWEGDGLKSNWRFVQNFHLQSKQYNITIKGWTQRDLFLSLLIRGTECCCLTSNLVI